MSEKTNPADLLHKFVEKYGWSDILSAELEARGDMKLGDFLLEADDKGLKDIVMKSTLNQLFGVKLKKPAPTKELQTSILDYMAESAKARKGGEGVYRGDIANSIEADPKHVSSALKVLKRDGTVKGKGKGRNTTWTLAA